MKSPRIALLLTSITFFACGGEAPLSSTEDNFNIKRICIPPRVSVDPARSLHVSDQPTLQGADFSMRRVLEQLATQNGNSAIDSTWLFRQWWDTQNPSPGLGLGPNCDDPDGSVCRQAGQQAIGTTGPSGQTPDEFLDSYFPIALVNRFDLAPSDGSHCGEYRIAYAKPGSVTGFNRNLIIFEAVLPNPSPSCGLAACEPVQRMWASLSAETDPVVRAEKLENFYFNGLPGFEPVVHFNHYTSSRSSRYGGASGQIRTNQFITPFWGLMEFKLQRTCRSKRRGAPCTLRFMATTVKQTPIPQLYDASLPGSSSPLASLAADFQAHFVTQVASLAVNDNNGFSYEVPDRFNDMLSNSDTTGNRPLNRYTVGGGDGSAFGQAIQAELNAIGSSLTPLNIIARAEKLSCAGCHNLNGPLGGGLSVPSPSFIHIGDVLNPGPGMNASSTMQNVFLPHREQIMETFLSSMACSSGCTPTKELLPTIGTVSLTRPETPIGGLRAH